MSKYEDASLILKLYELRREETMRAARHWFVRDFHPQCLDDFNQAMFGEHSGMLRMVVSYWDMAAALVNHGAINQPLFDDTNGEHIAVFSKIEPILPQIRSAHGPKFAANLEHLIDAIPNGRKRAETMRERMKNVRSELAAEMKA